MACPTISARLASSPHLSLSLSLSAALIVTARAVFHRHMQVVNVAHERNLILAIASCLLCSDRIFATILAFDLSCFSFLANACLTFTQLVLFRSRSCLCEFHVILVIIAEAVGPASIWHIVFSLCDDVYVWLSVCVCGPSVARVQVTDYVYLLTCRHCLSSG